VAASADQELVGGADKYRAACRACYVGHHTRQAAAAAHPEVALLKGGSTAGPLTPLVPAGARHATEQQQQQQKPQSGGRQERR
jgi:hypothetical protein